MIFHSLQTPAAGIYINQYIIDLQESVHVDFLYNAWQEVSLHYDVLRTCFDVRELTQKVHDQVAISWQNFGETPSLSVEEYLKEDKMCDFDFDVAPLFRCALFKLHDAHYKFIWTFHHSILDGRSAQIVVEKVLHVYDAKCRGVQASFAQSRCYCDYVLWMNKHNDDKKNAAFWKDYLQNFTDISLPQQQMQNSLQVQTQQIHLSLQDSEKLRNLCEEHHLTLNTIFMGVWAIILHRYTQQKHICFHTTRAMRNPNFEGIAEMVGVFINTTLFKVTINAAQPTVEWLRDIRKQWLLVRNHETVPLYDILRWGREQNINANCSSLVVFEKRSRDFLLRENRSCIRRSQTNYPINFMGYDEPQITLKISYSACFTCSFIRNVLQHVETLFRSMAHNVAKSVEELQFFSYSQKRCLLIERNNTKVDFDFEYSLLQFFENQAIENAQRTFVVDNNQNFTFATINTRANQLAHYLCSKGVTKGDFVGIYLPRSVDVIIGIIAIFKTRSAYIGLDTQQPQSRLLKMIDDAKPKWIITVSSLLPMLTESEAQIMCVDEQCLSKMSSSNIQRKTRSSDIAYVVYTSGSTGTPKGIVVSQKSLLNHTLAIIQRYDISQCDRRLQFASIGSDVLIAEIFPYFVCGGTIVIADNEQRMSIESFLDFLEKWQVTITGLPSVYWNEWVAMLAEGKTFFPKHLRAVLSGMDKMRTDYANIWRKKAPPSVRLFNVYGPSEATGTATVYEIKTLHNNKPVPIGKPIANTEVYIVNEDGNLLPQGAIGEIYIGGYGVSYGYLNKSQLNEQKFIANSFTGKGHLYKTGDLGYYDCDGNIQFVSRKDFQVKIRGFRVELCEIEQVINSIDYVEQTVVKVFESNDGKKLIAYVQTSCELQKNNVYEGMREKLPAYMIPEDIVFVDRFPILPSGKIDRAKLYEPQVKSIRNLTLPRNFQERVVYEAYKHVLNHDEIDIFENFFYMGGHSLLIYPLFEYIERKTNISIPLTTIFANATVVSLAKRLESCHLGNSYIVPANKGCEPPLICIHSGEGSGLNYRYLVAQLNNEAYIISAPREDRSFKLFHCIEETACYYIDGLLNQVPRDEYFLLGHSFGGTIAYEMARQLQMRDIKVRFLGLLDTMIVNHMRGIDDRNVLSPQYREFAQYQQQLQYKYFCAQHLYSKPIHLFRVHRGNAAKDYGWGAYAQTKVYIHYVCGDHRSFLYENNAKEVADKIANIFVNEDTPW